MAAAATLETSPYRDAFERRKRELKSEEAGWLATLRQEAMGRFLSLGFPSTRQEAWKHTNVARIARTSFAPADAGLRSPAVRSELARLGFGGAFEGREAVFVNGRFAPDLSSFAQSGVELLSLGESLSREPSPESRLGRLPAARDNPFSALNTALFEDLALLKIAPGARLEEPLHLLYLSMSEGAAAPTVSYPRTLILCGRDSEAQIVLSYGGPKGERYFTSAVTEVHLDDGAVLDHLKLQRESPEAFHVACLGVTQARDSRFSDHSICVGGSLVRNDVDVLLDAPGADCTLNGLFIADAEQLMDTHTRVDHAKPHGTSRELYKGILNGRSRGVFHGSILVRKDAQKTDAHQTNRNLLLSREALVSSTPQLEIFADDVKCKHGSTTGQLDPMALFYLQSRGISAEAARSLLTFAFASDLVSRIPVPIVRSTLETFLQERLPAAPKESVA